MRAFLQDAFSLPPAICRYPCLAAVRIFHASKALCTFSKGTNQRWGKNCCQRLYARCLPARSPIRRYPFLAYKRKGRSRDGRKHLFEKYDPKHGLVRAFLSVCNVGNSKKHCCMCFSLSVSAVSFQVSASVGTTPYRQSKFRRSVSVLKTAVPFKCGHFTRYHKRWDSNPRPPDPKSGAIPNLATVQSLLVPLWSGLSGDANPEMKQSLSPVSIRPVSLCISSPKA